MYAKPSTGIGVRILKVSEALDDLATLVRYFNQAVAESQDEDDYVFEKD